MLSLCSGLRWGVVVLQVTTFIITFYQTLSLLSCFEANLNGEYFSDPTDNGYYRGIIWELWLGDYSLMETRMMIRLAAFTPNERASNILPPDP